MDINHYQIEAVETSQLKDSEKALLVYLLGLSGETGSLVTEYKKHLRDGHAYKIFNDRISEELGDIIWYVSAIATQQGLTMGDILKKNLEKTQSRWKEQEEHSLLSELEPVLFDDSFPEKERFPRELVIKISEIYKDNNSVSVSVLVNGEPCGDEISDNAYEDDGYRFHDVFHFSYVTVLGWSPVVRKLLTCKRKSNHKYDEVEDGGRASVIDEAISALVFEYAKKHSFLKNVKTVDESLLKLISDLTLHLEVRTCTKKEWEKAILLGYEMWRLVKENKGGTLICDLNEKTMAYEKNI